MRLLGAALYVLYLSTCLWIALLIRKARSDVLSPTKDKEKRYERARRHRTRTINIYDDEEEYDDYIEDVDDDIFESLGRQAAAFGLDESEPLPFNEEERAEFEEMMQMIDSVDWGEGSVDEISALMDGLGLNFTDEEIESLASIVKDEELAHSSDMLGEFREVIAELQKDGQSLTESEVMDVIDALGGDLKVSKAEIDSIVNSVQSNGRKCPASFEHDRLLKAVQENDYFLVRCVVKVHQEIDFDLDATDGDGNTALMWAAFGGHQDIVEILLELESLDINKVDSIGLTSLMYACTQGHESIVSTLLDYNADVNIKDSDGNTALIWAARMGYDKIVRKLVNACADIDVKNDKQESAASEGKDFKNVIKAMNKVPKHCNKIRTKHVSGEDDGYDTEF